MRRWETERKRRREGREGGGGELFSTVFQTSLPTRVDFDAAHRWQIFHLLIKSLP